MNPEVIQTNVSFNASPARWRGMHYQPTRTERPRSWRCVRGAIFDVSVDVRADSAGRARLQWCRAERVKRTRSVHPLLLCPRPSDLSADARVHYLRASLRAGGGARRALGHPAFRLECPHAPEGERVISERYASYPAHGVT